MLEVEIAFYEEQRAELLARHAGMFVLIKGRELIGVFNTIEQALAEGARRFGLDSYLVRQVTLGILKAS
jgi:hypothetical protein